MDNSKIIYYFESDSMPTRAFEVNVARSMSPRSGQADWTRLSHHQCENCPLDAEAFSHCPAAVDLEVVVDAFNEVLELDEVRTVVEMPNGRQMHHTSDAKSALGALLGLIMASSPCPILSRLKGLAMTHNPFQSTDETVFRFISAYLMGQFVELRRGGEPIWDMDGLRAFLDDIDTLNRDFIKRLESASEQNPAVDGIRALMAGATNVRELLDSWDDKMDLYALPAVQSL